MNKLVGISTFAAVIAAALITPSTANASCFSINGKGGGGDCTSVKGSTAIGIGKGATAKADAPGSLAAAVGYNAKASTSGSKPWQIATAWGGKADASTSNGAFQIATAIGGDSRAEVRNGNGNIGTAIGGSARVLSGDAALIGPYGTSWNSATAIGSYADAYATNGTRLRALTVGRGSLTVVGDPSGSTASTNVRGVTIGKDSTNDGNSGSNYSRTVRGNNVEP